ncbi:alpha/beta hydrolase [Winogradskya consettensis]|uniref:Alpha/beta hydrolase n=1 Tax=Winogradskya consettensis TaxID=113560 RepID=A0A919SEE0_9ACTN|nr:alpha/beta hydrolase [Actinoplanes consettensis]GIM70235.1 alpha/beta hydrolase [Actinoplanes consettensis]
MANLSLADGRTLEYRVAGPADGMPLVLHSGTPSAARFHDPMVATAAKHGLRAIAISRPGYAGSTAQPGRTVGSAALDVTAVLDAIGADQFLTVGWSGGGPHALACAALLPERCLGAATVAGVAPYTAADLDWLAGMGAENIEEFGAAVAGSVPLGDYLTAQLPALTDVTGGQVADSLGDLISDVDRRALTGDFADFMAAALRAAVSTGIDGWRDDDLAFIEEWGFDLTTITTPVAIWQGEQDRMVPYAHGRWLATHVPGATVHLEPAEGHLSLMLLAFDAILGELKSWT